MANIKLSGVCMLLSQPLAEGTQVDLEIEIDLLPEYFQETKIQCRGTVARVEPQHVDGNLMFAATIDEIQLISSPTISEWPTNLTNPCNNNRGMQ